MKTNLKSKAISARRKLGQSSIENFARIYMKDHLKHEPSAAHLEIYHDLDQSFLQRGTRYALAAPRYFGKSTMLTLIYVVYAVCYQLERFIIIISDSADQARQLLSGVKGVFTSNRLLMEDFPEVCESGKPPKPPRWRDDDIITKNNIEILALGSGQKIRGRRFGANRPTLILVDDIQNDENVRNADQREKTRAWFTKAVLNAGSEKTNVVMLGNLLHQSCLLADYINPTVNLNWKKRLYKAIVKESPVLSLWEEYERVLSGRSTYRDERGKVGALNYYIEYCDQMEEGSETLWPQRWSYFYLYDLRMQNPRTFSSEMQNEPLDPASLLFNAESFRYWTKEYPSREALIRTVGDKAQFFGACDPSMGIDGGDYSAIVILLKDLATNAVYVLAADIGRFDDTELVKRILDYQQLYRCVDFAYETNQFQRLLVRQLEEESIKRGIRLPLKEIKNSGNKQKRIEGLSSWVRNGTIQFDPGHTLLIDQLGEFPQGKHDDGPDALEMAVSVAFGDGAAAISQEEVDMLVEYAKEARRSLTIADPITGKIHRFRGEGF